jgi:Uma2 family endonuclease
VATTTGLITVEHYRKLPENGPFYYELRRGELVQVARPNWEHASIQRQIRRLLERALDATGVVDSEFAFRALPEYELRVADVAYVVRERAVSIKKNDNLHGAPDLVIEVLSPSNTAREIQEKADLCLANGCRQFWVVDSRLRQIAVSTPDGLARIYRSGESIPLALAENQPLMVDSVFVDK